jgi:hypothetical protein
MMHPLQCASSLVELQSIAALVFFIRLQSKWLGLLLGVAA